MKREILAFGIILLFVGLAISPTIYADNDKVCLESTPEFDYDGYTPIQLVFLLINKLRYYDVEDDSEINSIIEELESYSCGCEDEETIEGVYPIIICLILFVIFAVAINSSPFPVGLFVLISYGIADKLNCPFTQVR